MARAKRSTVEVKPLTTRTWKDLEELFGRPGASIVRGCWCMYYRRSGGGSGVGPGAQNKGALRALVDRGTVPGLIGYRDGRPVGWVSINPREEYAKLRRSPVMKPVDDRPVWSIVCFFVDRDARNEGVSEALLKGAMDYARSRGATLLEAYPVDKRERSHPDFLFFGAKRMFDRAGFREVARRTPNRPVMRRALRRPPGEGAPA
jgi:GNAT superfamily N-acetyltransferase